MYLINQSSKYSSKLYKYISIKYVLEISLNYYTSICTLNLLLLIGDIMCTNCTIYYYYRLKSCINYILDRVLTVQQSVSNFNKNRAKFINHIINTYLLSNLLINYTSVPI